MDGSLARDSLYIFPRKELVRFLPRDLPPSGLENRSHPGDDGGIRPEQGSAAVQQQAGQVKAGRKRIYAAAGVERCAYKVSVVLVPWSPFAHV